MSGPAFDRVLAALDQAGKRYKHDRPNHVMASCPGPNHKNGDRSPSLSITAIEGQVLMHCQSGDPIEVVLDALGLQPADLFDVNYQAHPSDLADLDRVHRHSFPPLGKPDKPARGESWYPREWERGHPIAWKVRQTCRSCGDRTFHWRQPDDRGGTKKGKPDGVMPLGGLPDLLDAIDSGKPVHVYGTEGDSDAEALRKLGMIAVTAGGTSGWKPEHVDQLDGVDRFTFCSDADAPGRSLAGRMRGWLTEREITHRVVEPIKGCKDVRDHLEANHALGELVEIAPAGDGSGK